MVDPTATKPDGWDDRREVSTQFDLILQRGPMASDLSACTRPLTSSLTHLLTRWPQLPDEDAVKPDDWLDDEPLMIPDATASQPNEWDEEEDGAWAPPYVRAGGWGWLGGAAT